jgi:hypothetical protein
MTPLQLPAATRARAYPHSSPGRARPSSVPRGGGRPTAALPIVQRRQAVVAEPEALAWIETMRHAIAIPAVKKQLADLLAAVAGEDPIDEPAAEPTYAPRPADPEREKFITGLRKR